MKLYGPYIICNSQMMLRVQIMSFFYVRSINDGLPLNINKPR